MNNRFPEMRKEFLGKQVTFLGASKEQINWGGNDDPNKHLLVGETYEVEDVEVHSWHTKIKLVGFEGVFNSSSFDVLESQ